MQERSIDEIADALPGGLWRKTLVAWLQSSAETLRGADPGAFYRETVAPAGMPMDIWSDDADLARLYCRRLTGRGTTAPPEARLFVLTGKTPLLGDIPRWDDTELDPAAFQRLTEAAHLKVAYPDLTWRFFDLTRQVGAQISTGHRGLAPWDASAPLRLPINWALEPKGLFLTHAASLGLDGKGVLLVGSGGAGKSGTTLAGLTAGLQTVGDDYLALGDGGQPRARSLFPLAKQDPAGLQRLPSLRDRMASAPLNWQGKIEFDLREAFPGAFVDELSIRAIVLPRVAHLDAPAVTPMAKAEVMMELMRSNLFRYLGGRETRMSRYADLVRRLPCYRVDLSGDALANGSALRELIESLANLCLP